MNVLIPRLANINYSLSDALRLGLRFNGSIKSYNLNEPYNGKDAIPGQIAQLILSCIYAGPKGGSWSKAE